MVLASAQRWTHRKRELVEVEVAPGRTMYPGQRVMVELSSGADQGKLVYGDGSDLSLVFFGIVVSQNAVGAGKLCPVLCSARVLTELLNDNNKDLVGLSSWTTTADTMTRDLHPFGAAPEAVIVRHEDDEAAGFMTTFYKHLLFSPATFKAFREGKKSDYTEP